MASQTEVFWRQLPGVRTQERTRFLFFASLATLVSLAQTLGLTGAEALFLGHYGAESLPVTFIAAALVTVLGSMVYAARVGVQRNDGLFVQMLAGAAVVLAAAAAAVEAGYLIVLPGLFCFFYLCQAVFVNHMWTFTGDYFDTVASKRLVPLFTIGASVGGLIGGVFAIGITYFVGPVSLIFAWAGFLALAAWLVRSRRTELLRWGPLEVEEADETSLEGIQAAMRYLGTSRLGRWLCVSALSMMLSLFVMQYLYSEIFARRFPDAADLAAFFGIYLTVTNLLEIVIEMRLTPWLIQRLGVPAANLIHPILTLASFGGLAFQFGLNAGLAARANRELLENSVAGPLRALVYNAMPRRHRGRTRAFLEGIIVYAGMALSGLVLLAIEAPDPVWLCAAGGALAVVYLFANLKVRSEYLRTLVAALRAGSLDLDDLGDEVGGWEANRLAEMWEQLLLAEHDSPSRSLLALVPNLAARGIYEPLIRGTTHPHPDVRRSCLTAVASAELAEAEAALLAGLEDPDAGVRLAALRGLIHRLREPQALEPVLRRLLADPSPPVCAEAAHAMGEAGSSALSAMIRAGEQEVALPALRCAGVLVQAAVLERMHDEDPIIRAAALESIARSTREPPIDVDAALATLRDPDAGVRRAGVMLLANVDDSEVIYAIAGCLGDPAQDVGFAAETVLGSMGEFGLDAVTPVLRAKNRRAVEGALRVVDAVGTPAAGELLRRELRHRAREIWRAMVGHQLIPDDGNTGHTFLRIALADDIMRSRRISFYIIELIEDANVVRRVDRALHFGSNRAKGDALEILSHLGDREAAGLLVLAHESGPLAERANAVADIVLTAHTGAQLIDAALISESRWISMAARAIRATPGRDPQEEKLMERLLALKQVPLFSQLSFEQLDAIQQIARELEYMANETIVKEGDPGGELYLLIEGKVRIFKGYGTLNERTLSTVSAVSYFGEMAAIDEQPRSATVVAAVRSRMLCLDSLSLKDLVRQMPEISFEIMRVLTARIRAAESRLSKE